MVTAGKSLTRDAKKADGFCEYSCPGVEGRGPRLSVPAAVIGFLFGQ